MIKDHFGWFLRSLPLDRNVVAAGSGCGTRRGSQGRGNGKALRSISPARSSTWPRLLLSPVMTRVCGTVDGPGDRDPTLPLRAGDHRRCCWSPAAEIATPPGTRGAGLVNLKFLLLQIREARTGGRR